MDYREKTLTVNIKAPTQKYRLSMIALATNQIQYLFTEAELIMNSWKNKLCLSLLTCTWSQNFIKIFYIVTSSCLYHPKKCWTILVISFIKNTLWKYISNENFSHKPKAQLSYNSVTSALFTGYEECKSDIKCIIKFCVFFFIFKFFFLICAFIVISEYWTKLMDFWHLEISVYHVWCKKCTNYTHTLISRLTVL